MTSSFLARLERQLLDIDSDLTHLDIPSRVSYVKSKASSLEVPIISESDLCERWQRRASDGEPLRVKFGIDPTGPEIHLGHAVPLLNLRRFLRLGCSIEFVVGDFTALIGDPSGRNEERPSITEDMIASNMRSYRAQARRVLDVDNPRVRWSYNRSWMTNVDLVRWQQLTSGLSVSDLIQRSDFRSRLAAGHSLSLAELEYAVYMAYDSVVLQPDVEIGGIDQLLNMQVCRRLMLSMSQTPEVVVTYDLLSGTTGERDSEGRAVKMSKSRNNYIPVMAEPSDMYGLTMSIPDAVMPDWYRNLTEISAADLKELVARISSGEIHPKAAKELLAQVVVATFHAHDAQAGVRAKLVLARTSGQSNKHVRRVAAQGGMRLQAEGMGPVTISQQEVDKPAATFAGSVVRMGRHLLVRIRSDA